MYSFKFDVVLPDTTYKVNKPYNVILEKDKINKSAFRITERAPLYLLLYFNKPQPYGRLWYNTHTVLFKHNYTLKKHPFFFTWKASAWPSSANSSLHFTTYKKTTKILNSKLFLITKKEDTFLSFFYKDPLYVLHVFSGSHHNTLNSYFVNKEILTNDNNNSILHDLKKMRFSMDCLSVYESAHRVRYIDAYNHLKRTITVLNRFNIFNKLKATTAYSGLCYKQDLQWSQYVAQYVAKVKQWTLRLSHRYIICRHHQQKQQQSTLLFNC